MPNVVLIHTHDTGRYIGPNGYDIETPTLSRLADEGIRFRNAFCAAPTCSPSRAALMTGQCPHSNGMLGLAHRGFSLDDYGRHIATYLGERGIETVLAGLQHEARQEAVDDGDLARDVLGYDTVLAGDRTSVDGPDWATDDGTAQDLATAAGTAAFLRERDADADPFFLSVGLFNSHKPMPLDQTVINPDRVQPPAPLPDVEPVREEMAAFHLLVRYVDRCVETVLDGLADSGLRDDTLVVFTTDHGIPFPYMKCTLRDDGIGVSLLACFPDGYRAGETEDALVSTMDLYPTFCEYLDVPVPEWVEAVSQMPVVTGERDSVREQVVAEVNYHSAYEPMRCVRTDRYKYIRRFDTQHTRVVEANIDDGPSKRFLVDHGLREREPPREALYDLYHDPNEQDNLAADSARQDVREAMVDRLEVWMERTEDPLLEGAVPAPPGADVDSPGSVCDGGK